MYRPGVLIVARRIASEKVLQQLAG